MLQRWPIQLSNCRNGAARTILSMVVTLSWLDSNPQLVVANGDYNNGNILLVDADSDHGVLLNTTLPSFRPHTLIGPRSFLLQSFLIGLCEYTQICPSHKENPPTCRERACGFQPALHHRSLHDKVLFNGLPTARSHRTPSIPPIHVL